MTRGLTPLLSRASFRNRSLQIRNGGELSEEIHMAGTEPKTRFGKVIEIFLWLAALGVLAENISLLRQNQGLREVLAPQIVAGTQLKMLSGLALDGRLEPVALPAAGSKLLLITFSPGCPACQANQDGWMKLASALEQKGVRVLWVSRDPIEITRDYCIKHSIRLSDTLADPPYRTYAQLGLARVPNTLLLGPGGTVEKVWAGRLDQAGWNTMFAYFGARQEMASPTRSEVGANPTGCGSESSQASAKNCK
jgi:peroxiredoxin